MHARGFHTPARGQGAAAAVMMALITCLLATATDGHTLAADPSLPSSSEEGSLGITPSVERTALRLQRRLLRHHGLSVSLPVLNRAVAEQRALLGSTVTVRIITADGGELEPWTVSLHHYPQWMQARLMRDFRFSLNHDAIKEFFSLSHPGSVTPPVDVSVLEMHDDRGVLRARTDGIAQEGYRLNPDAAADTLLHAIQGGFTEAVLTAVRVPGAVINKSGADLGSLELLATGRSDFSGSGLGRKANVRRGLAQYLHNTVVRPGETFSFNAVMRDMEDSGWEMASGIFQGELRPVPGGGICQVATTLYRSVLLAALPVVTRSPHSLYVSYYEEHGVGIDATVYPGEQDLAFLNDTGHPLLLQAWYEGDNAYVSVYGTSDGRTASLTGPYFSGNAPEELRIDGRPLRRNEIAWYQDIRRPGRATERTVIYSRYQGMPQSLGKKYAAQQLTMLP